jgi:hypothetical protein
METPSKRAAYEKRFPSLPAENTKDPSKLAATWVTAPSCIRSKKDRSKLLESCRRSYMMSNKDAIQKHTVPSSAPRSSKCPGADSCSDSTLPHCPAIGYTCLVSRQQKSSANTMSGFESSILHSKSIPEPFPPRDRRMEPCDVYQAYCAGPEIGSGGGGA